MSEPVEVVLVDTYRARARRASRARKRMRAAMATRDRTGCPRPDKLAFDVAMPEEADRVQRLRAHDSTVELYLCRCGWWHLGHPPRSGQ